MRRGGALCAVAAASGCSDTAGPSRGTLSGTVVLADAWASRLDDFSGVTVTLDGLSTGAVTDAAGAWALDAVPAGRHNITFKKATFPPVQLLSQPVNGPSTTAPPVTMALTPWQQAIIDSIHVQTSSQSGKDYYLVDGHLSAPPPATAKAVSTVVFVGKTDAVSPDTLSYDQWNLFVDPTGKSSRFLIVLSADATHSIFGSGARVFAAAYAMSAVCSNCGSDSPTAKPFFPNTGPRANVVQLTVR
jgi:hypothetical protein